MKRPVYIALFCLGASASSATLAPAAPASSGQVVVNALTGNARGSRDTARALRAESDALLAKADYEGALAKRLQMLTLRSADSTTLGAYTGSAIQSLAIQDLGTIAEHLDASSCRKFAAQLLAIDAIVPSYTTLIEKDEVSELKWLGRVSSKPKDWDDVISHFGFSPEQQRTLRATPLSQIRTNIHNLYNQRIQRSKKPYAIWTSEIAVDPYTEMVCSAPHRYSWARPKLERTLAILALQDRANHLEHKNPATSLPADPFGKGPLKVKNGVVYSIGPDLKDDGGKPVPFPRSVGPDAKGDVPAPVFWGSK